MRIASIPYRRMAAAFAVVLAAMAGTPKAQGSDRASSFVRVQIVSPFLLPAFAGTPTNLNLAGVLANSSALAAAQAKGIVADGTSEAIVIYRTLLNLPVRFSAPGAVLTPYADDMLTRGPTGGGDRLTVRPGHFIVVNGQRYAAALVRAPAGVSSLPITAGHELGYDATIGLPVVPPPVILAHGLWGDASSLEYLRQYLAATAPWSANPAAIYPIEYTNYLPFDDAEPWGVLDSAITSAIGALDAQQIVGGRVDVVAHSMGGLVSRVYSTKPQYHSYHDRGLGRFRQIVTIDTPEAGSPLADFLLARRGDTQNVFAGVPGVVWSILCNGDAAAPKTVEECLEIAGMPIVPPDNPSAPGAVQSLSQTSANLLAIGAVSPKIANSKWQAIQSAVTDAGGCNVAGNSAHALVYLLNCFIAGTSNTTTIGGIFGAPNDGIVSSVSQVAAGTPDHLVSLTTPNLAHTNPTVTSLFGHPTGYVTHSDLVNGYAACWLANSDDSCASAGAQSAKAPIQAKPAPAPFLTRRLTIERPASAVIGEPIVLTARGTTAGLARLVVQQRDEQGRIGGTEEARITVVSAGQVRADIAPAFLGTVGLTIWVVYDDGGIVMQRFSVAVGVPATAPVSLRADANVQAVTLGHVGAFYRLRPMARYSSAGEPVRLERRVSMHLLESGSLPVVTLDADGKVTALRAGTATVEVRFGPSAARIKVVVRPGA